MRKETGRREGWDERRSRIFPRVSHTPKYDNILTALAPRIGFVQPPLVGREIVAPQSNCLPLRGEKLTEKTIGEEIGSNQELLFIEKKN